ncbi:MAG: cytochrome c biogenesis protein CcsA [Planctomycetota bacterium]|nr:cytochrome c biogenesis protein CcsA [Planctomycetota bacterium]
MAVKLTDLGILIYAVMALYLAAAVGFARRRHAVAGVLAVVGLVDAGLAVAFRLLASGDQRFRTAFEVLFAAGLILYAALALALALGALVKRERLAGTALFVAGFGVAVAGFVLRWVEVKHAPLQNMFEVFLCLGMLMWPLSLFCRRLLNVGGEGFDAILGFIVLFAAGFVFKAEPQHLPPALQSFLFIPHVAAYMLSYVILAKAALHALWAFGWTTRIAIIIFGVHRVVLALIMPAHHTMWWSCPGWILLPAMTGSYQAAGGNWSAWAALAAISDLIVNAAIVALFVTAKAMPMETRDAREDAANRTARLGFPLLTLGLVLGMWWGKRAWGDYWNWDPKELASLVSWLVYLGYFHFRYMFGLKFKRINCALLLVGLAAIIVTLIIVNLLHIFASGMHSYAS